MANYRYMMSAEDIAKELNCSKSHAYKIVKELNNLQDRNILQWQDVFRGRFGQRKCKVMSYQ